METFQMQQITASMQTFYPTYKEWKHKRRNNCIASFILFILPIRNGNHLSSRLLHIFPQFLFILPIRNGNEEYKQEVLRALETFYPTYKEWKRGKKRTN